MGLKERFAESYAKSKTMSGPEKKEQMKSWVNY